MNNPCAPSERQLLAWQDIAAPPKLFPADIAHEHQNCIVDENPPSSLQRNAHEIFRAEVAEELAMERRRIEESDGLQSRLEEAGVALDEHPYQNRAEHPFLSRLFFPQCEPRCRDSEEVLPIASIHKAREGCCPEPCRCTWSRKPQPFLNTFPRDRALINGRADKSSCQHARQRQDLFLVVRAPPRSSRLPEIW